MPNCQVNDTAVLVRNTTDECMLQGVQGAMVKIISLHKVSPKYGHIWNIEHPLHCPGCGKQIDRLFDVDLQPIRGMPLGKSIDETKKILEPV